MTTTDRTGADRAGIDAVLATYEACLRSGDPGPLRDVFRDEALVSGYVDDEVFLKSAEFLYDFMKANPPTPEQQAAYRCETVSVEHHRKTATVVVRETAYLGADYVTSLHLIEDGGRWWILSKLFDGVSPQS